MKNEMIIELEAKDEAPHIADRIRVYEFKRAVKKSHYDLYVAEVQFFGLLLGLVVTTFLVGMIGILVSGGA